MRKHSSISIREKLAEAEALQSRGVAQKDICKQLGISVMTLHRWRKRSSISSDAVQTLRRENDRLRSIAIQIMLDIQALEETKAERPLAQQRPQRMPTAPARSMAAAEMIALLTSNEAGMSPDRVEDMPAY